MSKCEKCGMEYEKEYIFCPKCGAKMRNVLEINYRKKQKKLRKAIIFSGLAAVLVLAVVCLIEIQQREELVINQGHTIKMNVGDSTKLTVSGDGWKTRNNKDITWISSNDKVVKINNGVLETYYDEESFFSHVNNHDSSYSAYVNCKYKDGKKKWAGEIKVVVSLIPVDFESGEILKGPVGSGGALFDATLSNKYNTLLYLKCKTNKDNDMAFLIKKGENKSINIPVDTYELYIAQGTTWYGRELLFGPKGKYLVEDFEYVIDEPGCGFEVDLNTIYDYSNYVGISIWDFPSCK